MNRRIFTKQELSEYLDVPLRTIQYYTDKGLIVPGIANPKGKGARRLYSAQNAIEFELIGILSAHGFTLSQIAALFEYARKNKIDKKWDPEGIWASKEQNASAQLVITDALGNPKMMMVGMDELIEVIRSKGKLTTLIINVGDLFSDLGAR